MPCDAVGMVPRCQDDISNTGFTRHHASQKLNCGVDGKTDLCQRFGALQMPDGYPGKSLLKTRWVLLLTILPKGEEVPLQLICVPPREPVLSGEALLTVGGILLPMVLST